MFPNKILFKKIKQIWVYGRVECIHTQIARTGKSYSDSGHRDIIAQTAFTIIPFSY